MRASAVMIVTLALFRILSFQLLLFFWTRLMCSTLNFLLVVIWLKCVFGSVNVSLFWSWSTLIYSTVNFLLVVIWLQCVFGSVDLSLFCTSPGGIPQFVFYEMMKPSSDLWYYCYPFFVHHHGRADPVTCCRETNIEPHRIRRPRRQCHLSWFWWKTTSPKDNRTMTVLEVISRLDW